MCFSCTYISNKAYFQTLIILTYNNNECIISLFKLLLQCAAGEETAENRYFYAAFFAEKSAKVGITNQEEATAEKLFQEVERHLSAETRPVTVRCQIRAKNRQVGFYVKSSRHVKHLDFQREVPEEQMTKACQLIEEIEQNLLVHYPKKPLLSFDIVKTDYFIRRGNFEQGKPQISKLKRSAHHKSNNSCTLKAFCTLIDIVKKKVQEQCKIR